jgi:hypothetical protein
LSQSMSAADAGAAAAARAFKPAARGTSTVVAEGERGGGRDEEKDGRFFFSGQFSAVRFKANRETGHDAIGGADPRGARASARGDGRRLARKPSRASRTRRRGVVAREIAPCLAAARARRGEPWRREAAAAPRAAAGATHAAGISTIVRGASAFAVSGRREVRRRPFPCVGGTRERRKALGRAVRSVRGRGGARSAASI